MALVGDDQIEGVDRDVELFDVGVDGFAVDRQRLLAPEQVHRHPLDRRYVDEGVAGLRRGQQCVRHDGRIEGLVAEIGLLEALRVQRVDLVELQAGLGLEGGERADGLSGQGAAVDEEQHPPGDAGLHQPVDLVDSHQRLAGARGHRDEQLALALPDRVLDRRVRIHLVRTKARVLDLARERRELGVEVATEHLVEGVRRVERGDPARAVALAPHVVEADLLAVGRVQERHAVLALVARSLLDAAGVALRLRQHALRADCEPLGLDHRSHALRHAQGVVGRAVRSRHLGQCGRPQRGFQRHAGRLGHGPPGSLELRIDPKHPGFALTLAHVEAILSALSRRGGCVLIRLCYISSPHSICQSGPADNPTVG